MEKHFKAACWIAPDEPMTVTVFLRHFTLGQLPKSALLNITGLGYFEAYINGASITDDKFIPAPSDYFRRDFSGATYPVRDSFTHRIYFHTFDISDFLRQGENELKIVVGGGWFVQNERIAEGKMGYADRPRCIFEFNLDGEILASDGSEVYTDCEIRDTSLFIGETIDYTYTKREPKGVKTLPAPGSILTPTDADAESVKLVKIADKLCAYIKCLTEEAAGNREFIAARKSTEAILDSIDSDELRYFRENMLDAFSCSLDEL
jgi:hypothetical protein